MTLAWLLIADWRCDDNKGNGGHGNNDITIVNTNTNAAALASNNINIIISRRHVDILFKKCNQGHEYRTLIDSKYTLIIKDKTDEI